MLDYRVKVGFLTHPKTRKLRRRVGDGPALVALLGLWDFCRQSRPDGSLVGLEDEDIEDQASWTGEPGELVEHLVDLGWLDGGPGAYSFHNWPAHQEFAATQCDRNAGASAAAHTRWHLAGKHADEPKPGCPLCEQAGKDVTGEPSEPPENTTAPSKDVTNAAHDAAQCGRNAPTNQPTNQPTSTASKRTKRVAAHRSGSEEVLPASLPVLVDGWRGWSTRSWSRWSDRALAAGERCPITLDELEEVRRGIEQLRRKEGSKRPPNIGLLVSRLENRRRTGRAKPKPTQLPLLPDEKPGWQECGTAAKELLARVLGEQPLAQPA